ncbi:MAG: ATP-grasp domain-containing protein, partial [Candidatus Bathyarchaeia archaeon]
MKILEYEAKLILSKYGIPVPKGILATNVVEAREVAQKLRPPFAVKAQVPVSGRGKAGGILFAESIKDIEKAAEELFNRKIKGAPVRKILVEERIDILKELYLGMSIERLEKTYVIVGSTKGGIDVEEIAKESPHKVFRFSIDQFYGF